jgi:methyl-accepting chemotaxis protein
MESGTLTDAGQVKSNWTIGMKLTASCAVMLALMCVMGFVSLRTAGAINDQVVIATTKTARRLQLGGAIDTASSDMLAGMRGVVLFTFGKRPDMVLVAEKQFDNAAASWQSAMDEARPLLVTEEGKRLINELQGQLTAWKSVMLEVTGAASQNQPDDALRIAVTKGLPIYKDNSRDTVAFRDLQNRILARQGADAASVYNGAWWTSVSVFIGALIAGVLTLLVIRHSSAVLRRAASELDRSSRQVSSAAVQISSASQQLAQGASEQAASVEETSASTEQMSAMTQKNADDASAAANVMSEVSDVVRQANHTLADLEASMKEIDASSAKIAKIIHVIDEIAFQTNILALNAAVEAARAGEAGMGFAVVADEVRNLAQRSAQAARDTTAMIEESIARSNQGQVKLDYVSKAIASITQKSVSVNGLIEAVRAGSAQEAAGVGQISTAITQVEKVAQNAAAAAEQTASAGEELNAQAAALQELVASVNQLVGAGA